MSTSPKNTRLGDLIWDIANLLRGPYRPPQYRKVMLPFIVLRRIDLVLAPHKEAVLKLDKSLSARIDGTENPDKRAALQAIRKKQLSQAALPGQKNELFNTSPLDWEKITQQTTDHANNLLDYLAAFSPEAREIFSRFELNAQILKLEENNLLYKVMKEFEKPAVDLHPDRVSNLQMGYVFEDLVRRFNEQANEEAGDHFTPREVIELMTNLIYDADQESELFTPGIFRTIYDPTCGTGGMLSESETMILERNKQANLELYGQEYNPESWAICQSDMLIKQERISNIAFGDTLGNGRTEDAFPNEKFHYMLANPPFGVDWKKQKTVVEKEYNTFGFDGRFGAGLPSITDGALLFLQHMMSKMHAAPDEGGTGSKIAVVFNGSPLFTGSAGSGPSNIRRYVIENDWLDTIVALPDQLFYNTGIYTYVWIVTNRKPERRRGKIQLIDATRHFEKMGKSLGNKRNVISKEQIAEISSLYSNYQDGARSRVPGNDGKREDRVVGKVFDNREFGFLQMTVDRPLRLRFDFTAENLNGLQRHRNFERLATSKKRKEAEKLKEIQAGELLQAELLAMAQTLADGTTTKNRKTALKKIKDAARAHGLKLSAPVRSAFVDVLSTSDPTADICYNSKGDAEADSALRDTELIPLPPDIELPLPLGYSKKDSVEALNNLVEDHCEAYLDREVRPHVGEAWIDYSKTKVGYEIPVNRHFYVYEPPRPLAEIEADMRGVEEEILDLLKGL